MNKFGIVFGVAAVATLAGCKDPDYQHATPAAQNEVKTVDVGASVEVEPAVKKCTCPPGTTHAEPCTCGAADCKCVVAPKPVITVDLSKPATPALEVKPVEPEYTIYIVQNGDYLAKISKKYNVTISSIKRLNPSIKKDVIWVGQKIKLPGKVDVGEQKEPAKAAPVAKTTAKKSAFSPYTGATKEYVVKNGDTLGALAYGNGINIRQLKELNGLSSDSLKIGQKLKIPAEKVVKPAKTETAKPAEKAAASAGAAKPAEAAVAPAEAKPAEAVAAPVEAKPAEAVAASAEEAKPAEAVAAPVEGAAASAEKAEAPVSAAAATYVVQEGDDMTGVSIRWGVSAAEIRELNNLAEGDQLVPGQIIKLPADAQQ